MNNLRLRRLTLDNFRGIRDAEIDLDADIVLIHGRNGVGKSTLFDAIEYALFRSIRRLERLAPTWERWIPHVSGDGSFNVRLTFTTGQAIEIGRSDPASAPHYTNGDNFCRDHLLREPLKSTDDPKAVQALLLATHLLTQSQMSELAASSALDAHRLATLTGNDYLNACADAAKSICKVLEGRRAALVDDHDRCDRARQLANDYIGRRREIPKQHAEERQKVLDRLTTEHIVVSTNISPSPSDDYDEFSLKDLLKQEIVDRERRRATIEALNQATALDSGQSLVSLQAAFEAVVEERNSVLAERKKASEADTRAAAIFQRADERHRHQDLRRTLLYRCQQDLIRREQQTSEFEEYSKSVRTDTTVLAQTKATQQAARGAVSEEGDRLTMARTREGALRMALTLLLQRRGELREADNHLQDARADGTAIEAVARLRESLDRLRDIARSVSDCPLCGTAFTSSERLVLAIEAASRRLHIPFGERTSGMDLSGDAEDAVHARIQIASIRVDVARELLASTRDQILIDVLSQHATESIDEEGLVQKLGAALRTAQAHVSEHEGKLARLSAAALAADSMVQQLEAHLAHLERMRGAIEKSLDEINRSLADSARTLKLDFTPQLIADALAHDSVTLLSLAEEREIALLDHLSAQSDLKSAIFRAEEIETKVLEIEGRLQQKRERQNVRHALLSSAKVDPNASMNDLAADRDRLTRQVYVLRGLVQDLEEAAVERAELLREAINAETHIASLNQRRSVLQDQLETHELAIRLATEWEENLRKRIADSVDAFITPRNEEIYRCFSSLIPNAYRYDGVALRRNDYSLDMRLTFHNSRHRGASIDDGSPEHYLSAAQMSVLVVSIFLTLAEGQRWSNLNTVLLDDPVEHLDNLDAVAFLDGLRAFVRTSSKQLIISTCDYNLYCLMMRKFGAPWRGSNRSMIAMTLEDDPIKGIVVRYDRVKEGSNH